MELKPLVLLDMDGAVNAWNIRNRDDADAVRAAVIPLSPWAAVIHPETRDALRVILGAGAEILWCSSWRGTANRIMGSFYELGLVPAGTEWGVITDGGSFATDLRGTAWKLDAVLTDERVTQALEEGRPVYWIEDFGWRSGMWMIAETPIRAAGIIPIDTWMKGFLSTIHLVGHEPLLNIPSCHAAQDGECFWEGCPQIKDGEPKKSGRHCPLDTEVMEW